MAAPPSSVLATASSYLCCCVVAISVEGFVVGRFGRVPVQCGWQGVVRGQEGEREKAPVETCFQVSFKELIARTTVGVWKGDVRGRERQSKRQLGVLGSTSYARHDGAPPTRPHYTRYPDTRCTHLLQTKSLGARNQREKPL